MYLLSVVKGINNDKRTCVAEDLYKLNEAVFNLPGDDTVDGKTNSKLFQAVQKVVKAYSAGQYDTSDPNFFYDYVALLSTMQNQHFLSQAQNKQTLAHLLEALGKDQDKKGKKKPEAKPKVDSGAAKDIARLEEENKKLAEQVAKLRSLSDAVTVIKTFKAPKSAPVAEEKKKEKPAAEKEDSKEKPPKAEAKSAEPEKTEKTKKKSKKSKKPQSDDIKSKLDEMRELRKTLRKDGKSADEIKEAMAPLLVSLKDLRSEEKETRRAEKAKEAEE